MVWGTNGLRYEVRKRKENGGRRTEKNKLYDDVDEWYLVILSLPYAALPADAMLSKYSVDNNGSGNQTLVQDTVWPNKLDKITGNYRKNRI